MPIDRHPPGIPHKGQDQQARQRKFLWIPKLRQADHHFLVPLGRLIFVGAEQPIPLGQTEPVVAVGFPNDHRVVNPVHVRCHDQKPQQPIDAAGNRDIAVIEHGSGV